MKIPKRPRPNVIRVSDGKQWDDPAAQQGVHLTAFGARLAWLFFGFILVLAMVLIIIGR